jgi:hypothetical protein
MHFTIPTPDLSTVKLYPRLAMTKPSKKPSPIQRSVVATRPPKSNTVDTAAAQTRVRARLLRMIIENEQVRRNEQRPSAS